MSKKYQTYVCDLAFYPGETPLVNRHTDCLSSALHEPEPEGYIAWHEWAKWKAKTHRQQRCPDCRLWAIWTPKKPKAA